MNPRANRVPANLDPFKLLYRIEGHNKIIIEVETPPQWARSIGDALGLLTNLSGLITRTVDAAQRDIHSEEVNAARRFRFASVVRSYQQLRNDGWKHRRAIHALVADPQFSDLNFLPSDFNWCIKAYGGLSVPSEAPKLCPVISVTSRKARKS